MGDKEEIAIKIDNLCKNYKMYKSKKNRLIEMIFPKIQKHENFSAMKDLNLEVKKGEVLGILGKNGAGKSTLLKMITGVAAPSSGNIKINGKISSLLELGTAFNSELTGLENIYQNGQVMGLTREQIEERKQEIIDFADIGEHLYQPVKTYSSGMFARLAFACAINVDPDILIVDEVLSVGDMSFQLKCFKKFEQFKNKGKTILFVTHSITDILKNCTRTIILENGQKIFDGGVKEGVEEYKKIMVGLASKKENTQEEKYQKKEQTDTWKSHFQENTEIIHYGNGKAEVIDYGIFNQNGEFVSMIENDKEITLKSKVIFKENVSNPIFTMTLKDFKGLEISGTNTNIERIYTGEFLKGETAIIEFKQTFPVAPAKYTLSFSCTQINDKGELEVLDRKYDALLIEIITTKDTVGILRVDSKIKIEKE